MSTKKDQPVNSIPDAAQRALAEANKRRESKTKKLEQMPKEILGRKGPEPTRYGDWEKDGIISDF